MAKTQYSFSDDPTRPGRPSGFRIIVRDVYPSAGAGFVVALAGDIMIMPGLSKAPSGRGDSVASGRHDRGVVLMDFVDTHGAPKAIGPYSQATVAGGFLFTAGQIPIDPATGEMIEGGIGDQTARVLENLRAVLHAAGSDLSDVLKTTVFLVEMADFQAMSEVYARVFGQHRPACSTVAVAALPRGARVGIELVARVGGRGASAGQR